MPSSSDRILIHQTERNVEIFVEPGRKSAYDFIVRYREPGKRTRTPKHIHLVVNIFAKRTGDENLTNRLLKHIINDIILQVHPAQSYPPRLEIYTPATRQTSRPFEAFGEYSVEFLLIVTELLMLQEKTN